MVWLCNQRSFRPVGNLRFGGFSLQAGQINLTFQATWVKGMTFLRGEGTWYKSERKKHVSIVSFTRPVPRETGTKVSPVVLSEKVFQQQRKRTTRLDEHQSRGRRLLLPEGIRKYSPKKPEVVWENPAIYYFITFLIKLNPICVF